MNGALNLVVTGDENTMVFKLHSKRVKMKTTLKTSENDILHSTRVKMKTTLKTVKMTNYTENESK